MVYVLGVARVCHQLGYIISNSPLVVALCGLVSTEIPLLLFGRLVQSGLGGFSQPWLLPVLGHMAHKLALIWVDTV